jgi:predicted AlkP superfamily phosphohydrolase/phosphomutase
MTAAPRVMFLALDAASKDVALPWMDAGILPALAELRATAAWGTTANAPGLYTGSVWPTVWTGLGPGRHGCYYCEQLVPGTYEVADFLGDRVKREPFWNALGRAGRRLCLFDVPKAPLCPDTNGLQIVD